MGVNIDAREMPTVSIPGICGPPPADDLEEMGNASRSGVADSRLRYAAHDGAR
jgi:hypothetical protein